MTQKFILGYFEDEHKLVDVAHKLHADGVNIYDIFTPFPVHGLDDLLNIKRTNLPWITLIAGTVGLVAAILFQVWTSYCDWPLNVGGKPFLSIPAFIPITFEITVLFGALATVAAFLYKGKLFPGKAVCIMDKRQTDDLFIIALERDNAAVELDKIKIFFMDNGASDVRFTE